MRRSCGALFAAAVLAFGGPAGATVVKVHWFGEYALVTYPEGQPPSNPQGVPSHVTSTSTSGGLTTDLFDVGGIGSLLNFTWETDAGLSWTLASGTPSPVSSGSWSGFGLTKDLTVITGFSVTPYNGPGFVFTFTGVDYTLAARFFAGSLTDPYSFSSFPASGALGSYYQDATYFGRDGYVFSETLTPVPVPEPSSWALMILGFFALGTAIRRRRLTGTLRASIVRG